MTLLAWCGAGLFRNNGSGETKHESDYERLPLRVMLGKIHDRSDLDRSVAGAMIGRV